MNILRRYWKLYKVFVSQFIKSVLQSKMDFFIGLFGFFLSQVSGIIFIFLIFNQVPNLHNYNINQIIFIYGFAQIPRGIDHFITDNLWMLSSRIVIRGEFDSYLLRPMNIFFQVICERVQPDAVGELIVGFILIVISINNGTVKATLFNIIMFTIAVIAGAVIYTSIKLFFASLAFWIKDSSGILQIAYNLSEFAKYPTSIYAKSIQVILTLIIPFAVVSFYPASFFMNQKDVASSIGIEIITAVIAWIISYRIFTQGIKIYESSGN